MQKNATKYAKDISNLTCSTAENILKIGLLMLQAKETLNKTDYEEFLKLTNYDKKSPTVRKWKRIGESYVRLMPIVHNLPPHWSTIYAISGLDSNKLDLLERNNILNQSITLREINDALKIASNKLKINININFSSQVLSIDLLNMLEAIKDSIDMNLCEIKVSEDAQFLLDEAEAQTSTLKLAA